MDKVKEEKILDSEKHDEAVKKIQAILDEYGLQLGVTGIVLIPK